MSTTSKLEEAEHKVQTLQTGVFVFLLVQVTQGRLACGKFAGPPGPSTSPLTPVEPGGVKGARVPRRAPPQP